MPDILTKPSSRGELVFELTSRLGGYGSATISVLDDRGLTAREVFWREADDGSLAEAIVQAGLPADEANALAQEVRSEWDTRGEHLGRSATVIAVLTPVLVLLLVPLSVLWILIWVILQIT